MALSHCIDWALEVADLPAIKHVGIPGRQVSDLPCAQVYAGPGEFDASTVSGPYGFGIYEVEVAFHFPVQQVGENLPHMWELVGAFRKAVKDKELGNGVHGKGALSYRPFGGKIGNTQTHGVVFRLILESEEPRE